MKLSVQPKRNFLFLNFDLLRDMRGIQSGCLNRTDMEEGVL
jgi:hypothetical protein